MEVAVLVTSPLKILRPKLAVWRRVDRIAQRPLVAGWNAFAVQSVKDVVQRRDVSNLVILDVEPSLSPIARVNHPRTNDFRLKAEFGIGMIYLTK